MTDLALIWIFLELCCGSPPQVALGRMGEDVVTGHGAGSDGFINLTVVDTGIVGQKIRYVARKLCGCQSCRERCIRTNKSFILII